MLSSQALNVGRSLGQSLLSTQLFGGYHVYKVVWKPTIGEKLKADQELGNEADKFAVKVVKNNEIASHLPREYSRTLWYFIARGGKICVEVTGCRHHCIQLRGGMEIPCRLVFSCSNKVKINRLKELLESKIRRQTREDTNGSTTDS